jgi:hypothetical protein
MSSVAFGWVPCPSMAHDAFTSGGDRR